MTTRAPMFALVDMNNCFVSIERIFNPRLEGVPVCVLSSNDGCAVARSNEAKALGVRMGAPWYQMQDLARQHGIVALSSNFTLYADLSNRAMALLREYSPAVEQYSIDESFLAVEGMERIWPELPELGVSIRQRMLAWLGLPVCVGFGSSKTLAKLANHVAKKREAFQGVCDLGGLPAAEVDELMAGIEVGEVWGIGGRLTEQLHQMDIRTVLDLRNAPPKALRQRFGVVVERTSMELRGHSCLALEEVAPPQQQVMRAKSFGERVILLRDLEQAVIVYLTRAVEALRRQRSLCGAVHVFLQTDRHRAQEPQYSAGQTISLPDPSDDLRELAQYVTQILHRIYRPGFQYKKAGVMLMNLQAGDVRQETLFAGSAKPRTNELMKALEEINGRFGRDSVRLASAAGAARWTAKAERKTRHFTTDWSQVPVVH